MSKKIVAVMPIKLNSERLPNKNIKLLGDKPLLQYQLQAAVQSGITEKIYLYCSCENICSYLPEKVEFLKRPDQLDSADTNFTQIFECFKKQICADIYIYIHATAPFISIQTYNECVDAVKSGEYDSAFCACKIQDYLWQDNRTINFDSTNLPRSQDLPCIYRETSGIYVFSKEVFEQLHSRVGKNPYIKEISFKESIDINTPEDFRLAEHMLQYKA